MTQTVQASQDKIDTVQAKPPNRKMATYRALEAVTGYLFISPAMLGFLVFSLGALIAGLGLSLFEYSFFSPARFVGLENYRTLVADPRIVRIFGNTVYFVIVDGCDRFGMGIITSIGFE